MLHRHRAGAARPRRRGAGPLDRHRPGSSGPAGRCCTPPSGWARAAPAWLPPVAPRAYASTVHIGRHRGCGRRSGTDAVRLPLPGGWVGDGLGRRTAPGGGRAGRLRRAGWWGERVSLVVRARRVVLPGGRAGRRGAHRGRPDHRRHRRSTTTRPPPDGHPRRRRGAAARAGRQPRARQRARAHRVGGLRHRHRGPRSPAASPRSSTCRSTRSRRPTTVEALHVKRGRPRAARSRVDVAFWGGAVPGNLDQLRRAARRRRRRLQVLPARLRRAGVPAAGRRRPAGGAGRAGRLRRAADRARRGRRRHRGGADRPAAASYAGFLALPARRTAEETAIAGLVAAARDTGARAHVVHLADGRRAAAAAPAAAADGVRITVETCPHYLTFAAEEVPDGGDRVQVLPADPGARPPGGALGGAAAPATSTCVVCDHSPCTPELKRLDSGDFGAAWGGIASLQLSLPLVWTGARDAGLGADRRGAVDGGGAGAAGRAARQGRGSRSAATRTWSRSRPEETSWSTSARLRHRQPGHARTPGRTLHGVVRRDLAARAAADGPGRPAAAARGACRVSAPSVPRSR